MRRRQATISFTSTLYLCPVLELLLAEVPREWQMQIRLGLQEALVNAAKHGNRLDPNKIIVVRFSIEAEEYRWVITDQGSGFSPPDEIDPETLLEDESSQECGECGRGLFILHQIFDQVYWDAEGTELHLCKVLKQPSRLSFVRRQLALATTG